MKNQIGFLKGIAGTAFILFSIGQLNAQSNSELALAISNAQKANRAALTSYSWKISAEVKENGESKGTKLFQARFDSEGKLEITQTGGATPTATKPGLRGAVQKSAIENKQDYMESLLNLYKQYVFMTTGQLVDYFEKAMIVNDGANINVSGKDVLSAGDHVNMTCDSKTYLTNHLTFTATLDGEPVSGDVTFKAIEGGPTRTLKLEIKVPGKSMTLTAEMFDFIKQQ